MQGILGQTKAIELLQLALRSDRLHHAYIFHGPVGVGKLTTACRLARVLLCHDPQVDSVGQTAACGVCPSCRLLGSATSSATSANAVAHPDLHMVTKELARYSRDASVRGRKLTSIPVDVLRSALIEPVYRAPQLGSKKVFILDQAHLLNDTGQNILLKTLEQPPPGTYLILVTESQDKLLITLRSRCQRVAFVPLSDQVVGQWLDRQSFELTADQRTWLLSFVAGSLGRAQLVVDYGLFEWAQTVLPALDQMAQGRFPVDMGPQMAQRIDAFAKAWVDQHDGASKEAANRQAAGLMWSVIGQHARQNVVASSARCRVGEPEAAGQVLDPWLGVIDALETAWRQLGMGVNMGLVTDHLVSRMHRSLG